MKGEGRRPLWVALAVTAAVLLVEELVTGRAASLRVPVLSTTIAQGARVGAGTVRWVSPEQIRPVSSGFAREPLPAGTVLDAAVVGPRVSARPRAAVAVVPTAPAEASVAQEAPWVNVLVTSNSRVLWSSGPVTVDQGASQGQSGTLVVWMRPHQAVAFEMEQRRGTVDVLGVEP